MALAQCQPIPRRPAGCLQHSDLQDIEVHNKVVVEPKWICNMANTRWSLPLKRRHQSLRFGLVIRGTVYFHLDVVGAANLVYLDDLS